MKNRFYSFQFLTIIVSLVLFLWGLIFAFHFPIYPDEIIYRFNLERFFIDGGLKQSTFAYCTESFLTRPPVLFIPAAATWSLFLSLFKGSFWVYRIVPLISWIVILFVLYFNGKRYSNQTFWPMLLILLVGPTVQNLFMFRAEAPLLALATLIFFWGSTNVSKQSFKKIFLGLLLLIFGYSLALYLHPKAIYFTPVAILAIISQTRKIQRLSVQLGLRVFGISLIVGEMLSEYSFFSRFYNCKEYPLFVNFMKNQAINPLQFLLNPILFFKSFDQHYFDHLWTATVVHLSYSNNYYPTNGLKIENNINFLLIVRYIVLTVLALMLIFTSINLIKTIITNNNKNQSWNGFLLLLTGLVIICQYLLNTSLKFYDVSFLFGSIVILGCLAVPIYNKPLILPYYFYKTQKIVVNCIFLVLGFFGTIMNFKYYSRFLSGFEGPSIAISKFQYIKDNSLIVGKTLNNLKVKKEEPLLFDDMTYDMVRDNRILLPITYLGVFNFYIRNSPKDLPNTLSMYHVRFGVTRCGYKDEMNSKLIKITVIQTIKKNKTDDICIFKVSIIPKLIIKK